jgi:NADH-quinone oxidoreductase subunit E
MSWALTKQLESEIDELVAHYPQPRSASVMVLHALQDHFGWLSQEAIEWTAQRLSLQPINIYELVTFYPMFRQHPAGKYQIRVCRTLSCSLSGAGAVHRQLCERLGLDPQVCGLQTTSDGRFSVEFVECLASCGTAPVLLCDDTLHETVGPEAVGRILDECAAPPQRKARTPSKRKSPARPRSETKASPRAKKERKGT